MSSTNTNTPNKTPLDINAIRHDLDLLLGQDIMPECMKNAYCTAFVMALLFEPNKSGEMANNISYQLARLMVQFGVDVTAWQQDIATIYTEFSQRLKKEMELLQQQQKKEK